LYFQVLPTAIGNGTEADETTVVEPPGLELPEPELPDPDPDPEPDPEPAVVPPEDPAEPVLQAARKTPQAATSMVMALARPRRPCA